MTSHAPAHGRAMQSLAVADQLTMDDFNAMEDIEAAYYDRELIAPAAEAAEWYRALPESTIVLKDGDAIAGFINLLPVTAAVHESLAQGTFNDALMTTADIVDPRATDAGEPLRMFLSCIAVAPGYRGCRVGDKLMEQAVRAYSPWRKRCTTVLIDTATPAGEAFAARMGFTALGPTDHGTCVWSRDYEGLAAMFE